MPAERRTAFPEAAVAWMIGDAPQRILDLGSGRGQLARMLARSGHRVHGLDRSVSMITRLAERIPTGLHVAAQAESLPFADQVFDVASSAETLHKFAPGLVSVEIARVLRPGGRLVAIYNTRDDTVPWVKKLARILQQVDPEAMSGDFGQGSIETMAQTPYFTDLERKNFRNWLPIDRPGLLEMVSRRPATSGLGESERDALLAEVGDLYDSYARAPEPLLLPFQASCWRATVDHQELALTGADDGLEIPLGL
ncbi:SAM-dependent methyltransferase [Microlunatus endophyticus]|uniref:SAM-dependent methyltransferase n=1 Tax=Microlunatus endophyticus TaxID=1716077 RepID=A0A917SHJ8_9ACTN|nr:methyltransferase domain-containing protein [Microlunatus endophyticus]GGL81254.1 SAM-dependent methyltransferase [Microlunatus endophyticus]